jgi:ADP-glucose pyrophosphorylase
MPKMIIKREIIPQEIIEGKIFLIRGQKVMIDRDLAILYGVSTKRLNEQVKRNIKRFPPDFLIRLTNKEKSELVANCDRFKPLKHSVVNPYVFTEQGVAMLSSVLNSERAIEVNIQIMRAFVKLRQVLATHRELARKIQEYDHHIKRIFEILQQLLTVKKKTKRRIGFITDKKAKYHKK